MKKTFIFILLIANISFFKIAYGQSVEETKSFIIETIENYPVKNYRQSANFQEDSIILNYHMFNLNKDGTTNFCYNYAFDVNGIKYIRDGSEYQNDGTLVYKILIYIKKGHVCWESVGLYKKYPDFIPIYLGSKDELDKIRRALIHLCKLSGGTPSETNLFSE